MTGGDDDRRRGIDPGQVDTGFGASSTGAVSGPSQSIQRLAIRRVPFRIVAVGSFGLPLGRIHSLEADDLDEVLKRHRPKLDIAVDNRLTAGGGRLSASLSFTSLRDFNARAIADQVPEVARALEAARTLRAGGSAAEILADLPDTPSEPAASPTDRSDTGPTPSAPAPAPAPAAKTTAKNTGKTGDDTLDRIFDLVDGGAAPSQPETKPEDTGAAARAVSSFIGSMGRRSSAETSGSNGEALRRLEAAIAAQLGEILDHPEVRALEQAWRGLRFLMRRADRRADVFVDLINASKQDAGETLRGLLVDAAGDLPAGFGLILSLHDHGSGPGDIAALQALTEVAAEIQVPVLASAAPDFPKASEGTDIAALRDPETLFDTDAHQPWRSLRAKPVSRWLGVVFNRFQLREAVDLGADRAFGFSGAGPAGTMLEAGGALAVAALVAESQRDSGWPTDLTGGDRVLDGLPLYPAVGPNRSVSAVAATLRADAAGSFANAGLIALVGHADRDLVRIVRTPSAHKPGRSDGMDTPEHETIAYRLLLSRIIRLIEGNADILFTPASSEERARTMQAFLSDRLISTGPGAEATVSLISDPDSGDPMMDITLTTGRGILGGVTVRLDLPA